MTTNAKKQLDDFEALLQDHSRELVKTDDAPSTAVALPEDDGFAAAAADADSKLLKGPLLKFVDGLWTLGSVPVPAGTRYVPERIFKVWVRWEDRRPAQHEWPRPSGSLPHRSTLGYDDESKWAAGIDGQPDDPWKNTRYFWLVNPATGETFTYTNHTYGTHLAYEALGGAVGTMRKVHPKAWPIVELSSTQMKTKRGIKQRPHFAIVGWNGVGGPPQIENDMSDEIPF
jgi:hypothetical protein